MARWLAGTNRYHRGLGNSKNECRVSEHLSRIDLHTARQPKHYFVSDANECHRIFGEV
jgi:hypothetical protein